MRGDGDAVFDSRTAMGAGGYIDASVDSPTAGADSSPVEPYAYVSLYAQNPDRPVAPAVFRQASGSNRLGQDPTAATRLAVAADQDVTVAVPVPGTLVLLVPALAALCWARRRPVSIHESFSTCLNHHRTFLTTGATS
jgi:hypothetical protein